MCQLHMQVGLKNVVTARNYYAKTAQKAFSVIVRGNDRFINSEQFVLNYSRAYVLEYNVQFLRAWDSSIACDMD